MKKEGILILIAALLSISIFAQSKNQFNIPFEKYYLSNGLCVILHVDKTSPIASIYIRYDVGSGRERHYAIGCAHSGQCVARADGCRSESGG